MNKNKMYSAILSMLLLVPGQVWCSEQPVPQGILDRLMISMPATPTWMTNFTNSLSDTQKYLLYGGLIATLGYIGYRIKSIFSSSIFVPTSIDKRKLYKPNDRDFYADENCRNIIYITKNYQYVEGLKNPWREAAFQHYVCPILKKHDQVFRIQDNWKKFLDTISKESNKDIEFSMTPGDIGAKMFFLIQQTCPNKEIIDPLKRVLIDKMQDNPKILELLGQ